MSGYTGDLCKTQQAANGKTADAKSAVEKPAVEKPADANRMVIIAAVGGSSAFVVIVVIVIVGLFCCKRNRSRLVFTDIANFYFHNSFI